MNVVSLSMGGGIPADRPDQSIPGNRPEPGSPVEDQVVLSDEARRQAAGAPAAKDGEPLSDEDLRRLEGLKARDREVRAHEQAHLAAGGGIVRGGARYQYETGPDGARYAVAGEVSIDASPISEDPRANLRKADQIRRAALAPVNPSSQDRSVAAYASQLASESRRALAQQAYQESGSRDHQVVKGKNGPVSRFV